MALPSKSPSDQGQPWALCGDQTPLTGSHLSRENPGRGGCGCCCAMSALHARKLPPHDSFWPSPEERQNSRREKPLPYPPLTALAQQAWHLLVPHPGHRTCSPPCRDPRPTSPGPFQHSLQRFLQSCTAPLQDSSQAAAVSWADLGWRQQQLRALPCQEPTWDLTWELRAGPQELQELSLAGLTWLWHAVSTAVTSLAKPSDVAKAGACWHRVRTRRSKSSGGSTSWERARSRQESGSLLQHCWSHQGNPWGKASPSPAAPARPAVQAGVSLTKAPPGFGWKDSEEERCCSVALLVLPEGWSQLDPCRWASGQSRAGTSHLSTSCTECGSRHSSTSSHSSLVCSAPARAKQQGRASRGCQIHGDVPGPSWHLFTGVCPSQDRQKLQSAPFYCSG